jgi:hypothetical protein
MASSSSAALAAPAAEGRARRAALVALFARHPVAAVAGIWLVDVLLQSVFNLAAHAWTPTGIDAGFVALCAATLVLVAAMTALGWWRVSGFNRPAAWRDLRVLALPAGPGAGPATVGQPASADNSFLGTAKTRRARRTKLT